MESVLNNNGSALSFTPGRLGQIVLRWMERKYNHKHSPLIWEMTMIMMMMKIMTMLMYCFYSNPTVFFIDSFRKSLTDGFFLQWRHYSNDSRPQQNSRVSKTVTELSQRKLRRKEKYDCRNHSFYLIGHLLLLGTKNSLMCWRQEF